MSGDGEGEGQREGGSPGGSLGKFLRSPELQLCHNEQGMRFPATSGLSCRHEEVSMAPSKAGVRGDLLQGP